MIHLCVTPERAGKTRMMMQALADGMGGEPHRIVDGTPPEDVCPFVVWGQEWLALRIVPPAIRQRRPFYQLDNGFWQPARGTSRGYYRITYRSPSPVLLPMSDDLRSPTTTKKAWRVDGPGHVLLALPGIHFGMAWGIDVKGWSDRIVADVYARCQAIGRELRVRPRDTHRTLAADFRGCWAVVTHSSNVAVDAAIAGIPVFVQPTCPAAPVGRLDLDLAHPVTPGRKHWLRSLASQQFTLDEMRQGVAWHWMQRIAAHVDADSSLDNRAA